MILISGIDPMLADDAICTDHWHATGCFIFIPVLPVLSMSWCLLHNFYISYRHERRGLRGCTHTSALMSTTWLDPCPKKTLRIPTALTFHFPPTSIPVIALHVVWGLTFFFFWVGGSELISLGAQKAEGPLTPACWLSLHCLPAACCHGYLGSVAGQCSSSLMYDTASFTKQYCLCVAVISHLPGAFCSPLQPSPRSVGLPRTAWAEKRGRDRN